MAVPNGYQYLFGVCQGRRQLAVLDPGPAYFVAVNIWRWPLDSKPIRVMCHELASSNIPAPRGGAAWYPGTNHTILTNSIYAGRLGALRSYVREPKTRRKEGWGKSTCGKRPGEEWVWLEDFSVHNPIVSWDEWDAVQERLKKNKAESRVRSKRLVILGGMLFCGQCRKRLSGYSIPKVNL